MNIFDLQATISLNGDSFMQGVQQAQGAFQGLGSSVSAGAVAVGTMVGNLATKAASGLVDLGKESIQTGMNFDAAMSNVAAISGATGEEFDSLRDKAKEMGASTKFTATEAAEAFSYMAMAGWDASSMLSGIEGIMNLAAASGESLATTSDIVTDALTAFGLSAEDSGHFADVLAAASAAANTNVSMMGETFKYVAPLAGTMGYSVEDMATAIGTMANSGIKGSQAGTALRSAITRLAKPTKEVTTALGALGLDGGVITDSEGNMRSFSDTIGVLRGAFNGLSEADQAMYAGMIFGQEAMSGMLAIINASEADYNKLAETIGAASDAMDGMGTAAEMAQTQIDNLQGDVTIFQSAFDGLKTAIYDKFKEPLRDAVQTATEMMSTLTNAVNNGGISEAFATIGRSVSGFVTTKFDELTAKLGPFGETLREVAGIAAEYGGQIGAAVGDAFGKVRDTIAGFDFGSAFAGIRDKIGGAVDAIRPEIEAKIQTIRETISSVFEVFENIGDAFSGFDTGLFSTLGNAIGDFAGAFMQFKSVSFDAVAGGIRAFADALVSVDIGSTVSDIAGKVIELASAFAQTSAEVISGVSGAIRDFMDGLGDAGIAETIAGIAKSAGELFAKFLEVGKDVISDIGDNVKDFLDVFPSEEIGGIIGGIAKNIGDLFGKFKDVSGKLIGEIAEGIKGFWDALPKEAIANTIGTLAGVIGELFGHFTGALAGIIQTIGDKFAGFGEKITELWQEAAPAFEQMGEKFNGMVEVIGEAVGKLIDFIAPVAEWIAGEVVEMIRGGIESVVGVFDTLFESVGDLFDGIKEGIQGFIDLIEGDGTGAAEHFKKAWEDVKSFFSGLGEAFKEIGGEIVNGLKQGILDAWDSFTGWLDGMVGSLVSGVKGLFGIHSPSTVFAEIGSNLVAGMEVGWGREFGTLEKQVKRDLDSLTDTAQMKFADSAIGRSSAAGISSNMALYGQRGGDAVEINLVLDGDIAARALYDPLRRTTTQKGSGKEVAYA